MNKLPETIRLDIIRIDRLDIIRLDRPDRR